MAPDGGSQHAECVKRQIVQGRQKGTAVALARLNRDEDGQLRRLHFFESAGARLTPVFKELLTSLRSRDYRHQVREPFDRVTWGI
jgi:hypothetical protein